MVDPAPYSFVPLAFRRLAPGAMLQRAREFREELESRRSIRDFSSEAVPMEVLDECIRAAGLAPSGANRQPWTFVVVTDPAIKRKLRLAAEEEERELYNRRISDEWRDALAPLGTTWEKPFIESVPAVVVLFRRPFDIEQGKKVMNYYTQESVGIALGFFIAALHRAGLATLTHTPSPMGFLTEVLGRPKHEKAYVLLPIGYPEQGCQVPNITKKSLDDIRVHLGER